MSNLIHIFHNHFSRDFTECIQLSTEINTITNLCSWPVIVTNGMRTAPFWNHGGLYCNGKVNRSVKVTARRTIRR